MSQWTQVVGSINADSMLSIFGNHDPAELAAKAVGSWENPWFEYTEKESDPNYSWWPNALQMKRFFGDGPTVPTGSEGPLYFRTFNIGQRNALNNVLILFWGSLRDFGKEDVDRELTPFFASLVPRLTEAKILIRAMAIEIDIEYGERILLTARQGDKIKNGTMNRFVIPSEEA